MKTKLSSRFWIALLLFSLIGQVAWVVENMYFNVFIYKIFNASAFDISLMVAASAVAATLTTVFIGALSDRVGKRKLFICGGYILWGISILSFSLIRIDVIDNLFPMVTSAASVGITLVIIMDCVMTFFGSSANDAAFNAWLTDSTDSSNRGAAEGINSIMPLVAILVVFGGFMSFNLDLAESWTTIFIIIGVVVTLIGVLGIFLIKEPNFTPDKTGYFKTVFYGFSPKSFKENSKLYACLLAFIVFNISIQIFMPYLIIYYEVSLKMTDYVLVMAPAIVLASVVTALWGRVYDKKGFKFSSIISLVWLILGYALLFIFRTKLPVFIGSLLMMSGYLAGMAVFGAKIRDNTPDGKAGRLQGVRIFSQVLLPGLIGPFIGKTVLANAETIVGNDGTVSFVPSADIFLAAAVPAVILFIGVCIFSKPKKPRTTDLKTPYDVGSTPHDYHPTPNFKRDSFINLNGEWDFSVLHKDTTDFSGKITVPFPPESALSGVKRITKKNELLIYERNFTAEIKNGQRMLLHFGAVDNECSVFVNGKAVGGHLGGYLPFTIDITDSVLNGENSLKVLVSDSLNKTYPYGKQSLKRGGMWYTPVSGIWQTVWLETVPETYINKIKTTTTLDSVTVKVIGGEETKHLTLNGESYNFTGDEITIEIEDPKLWTPETPNIYEFSVTSGEDTVQSYFALRTVGTAEVNGKHYITLNGKPYLFHGLLDQGYFPDGIFMPASADGFKDDILKCKSLGFNMLRKHIKIEPQIFYYYCDTLGMAVFQDMVNNGRYSFFYDTALPTVGLKHLPRSEPELTRKVFYKTAEATLDLLYNHPSIVYYTIFNEGWGQHNADKAYDTLKPLDPTRIFDTASGWFKPKKSDVQSEHVYFKKADFKIGNKPCILSEFGGYSCNVENHVFNLDKVYGYKICKTPEDLTRDLEHLYSSEIIPLIEKGLGGAVLTQVSDVEDETNGLLTYDRKITKPDADTMLKIADSLKIAFQKETLI